VGWKASIFAVALVSGNAGFIARRRNGGKDFLIRGLSLTPALSRPTGEGELFPRPKVA
jgi:hypothetical protein